MTIESIDCDRMTIESAQVLYSMLKSIADDPRLLECGEARVFEEAKITHNGTRWVMKMEAFVPRI